MTRKFGDRELAEDLAQEAHLRVWQYAEHNDVLHLKPLLFKTAANLAANEFRSRGRMRASGVSVGIVEDAMEIVPSDDPSPERAAVARADAQVSLEAIRALPERQRRAFVMSRFEDQSYASIAQALGVSVSSVEKYIMAALAALRTAIDAQHSDNVVSLAKRRDEVQS
ncbi:MAG: sigma-70 family RNA polymerase sigma factor [Parvularculaceae bacterium]|nr:sigma-70 family RNA polymerase sigma factor [Parvularculaceae bacterium]